MASYWSWKPTFNSNQILALIFLLPFSIHALALNDQETTSAVQNSAQQDFVQDSNKTYGPITKTDTLWQIAVAHRPDTSVSNYQVMMAIFESNPNAFLRNDVNTMIEGQFLRIPTLAQIKSTEPYQYGKKPTQVSEKTVTTEAENNLRLVSTKTKEISVSESSTHKKNIIEPVKVSNLVNTENITTVDSIDSKLTVDVITQVDKSSERLNTATYDKQPHEPISDVKQQIKSYENDEFKESLEAVDNQLASLQYEMAKTSEKQAQVDELLAEQKRLLAFIKDREKQLIEQQDALQKQHDSFLYNPMSYWTTTGVLAVLITILFYLVNRRRHIENNKSNEIPEPVNVKIGSEIPQENFDQNVLNLTRDTVTKPNADSLIDPVEDTTSFSEPSEPDLPTNETEPNDIKVEFVIETKQEQTGNESMFGPVETLAENVHVETAFSKVDLIEQSSPSSRAAMSEDDLLNNLVVKADFDTEETAKKSEDALNLTTPEHEFNKESLDIDQIIEGMVDDKNKPVTLRSTKTGNEKATVKLDNDEGKILDSSEPGIINEIESYDDVEFDKLLAEISAQSEDFSSHSNVVSINAGVQPSQTNDEVRVDKDNEFVSVEELIHDGENTLETNDLYTKQQIDVGLDDFPEFQTGVNHINVDDDKHGVNAKLDLAQVYIEIGDTDNAAVILKNIMKLGNSGQQQKAQQLLYSLK